MESEVTIKLIAVGSNDKINKLILNCITVS